jgi:hypothetical protein
VGYRLSDMEILSEYPLSELENYKSHHRLRVFYFFGTTCVACGIQGTKLVKLQHKTIPEFHPVDVYTDKMKLMTVDHIIPKALGGRNTLENMQPMCSRCNSLKGDISDITNEELGVIVRNGVKNGKKVRGIEMSTRLSSLRNSSRQF